MERSDLQSQDGNDAAGAQALGRYEPAVLAYTRNMLRGGALRRVIQENPDRLAHADLIKALVDASLPPADEGQAAEADAGTDTKEPTGKDGNKDGNKDGDGESCKCAARLRRYVSSLDETLEPVQAPAAPIDGNLRLVAEVVGLTEAQRDLLQLLVFYHLERDFEDVCDRLGTLTWTALVRSLASALARPRTEIVDALAPSGRLASCGLVTTSNEPGILEDRLSLRQELVDLVHHPALSRELLLSAFVTPAADPLLVEDDFAHLREPVGVATALLGEALARRTPGVNILLYGPTGTGKTELARLVARSLGAELFDAGTSSSSGQEAPTPKQRLTQLQLGQQLLAQHRALLLFDELEDLWNHNVSGRDQGMTSKLWFNRLLETTPVPVIWISNDISMVDRAYLRRFSYAIEVRGMSARQRQRVIGRHLDGRSALRDDDVRQLAERFAVVPAQLSQAISAARLSGGIGAGLRPGESEAEAAVRERASLESLLAPMANLLGVRREREAGAGAGYRIDAAGNPAELGALLEQLRQLPPGFGRGDGPGLSLCLYGPPGTGKTAFVHHLGRVLDRHVVSRRASQIQSKWVGETEKNIADAFREAEEQGAILLFDEADSFLRDRRGAEHTWEVTAVNEFLQQMESFPGLLACTTNLFRELDAASLRRFTFKIRFDYLGPRAATVLVEERLGRFLDEPLGEEARRDLAPRLGRLSQLTPGDVAAVERRLTILCAGGRRFAIEEVLRELDAEVAVKEAPARRAGFG